VLTNTLVATAAPSALGALAMGMHSAAVKRLQVEGMFTTAATATVIFLMEDIITWHVRVAERRQLGVWSSLCSWARPREGCFWYTRPSTPTAAIALRERDAPDDRERR
jgi:hypothetical protein